jgi:uncharacterized protein (TIGR02271 family)
MISSDQLRSLAGKTAVGTDGDKIGKVVDVYESTAGPDATFVTVSTGLFGTHASFVPLVKADLRGDDLVLPYDKELVKEAPRVDNDEELTAPEEERLYEHYELLDTAAPTAAAAPATPAGAGHDTSGPDTDDAMTRSEEHLQVGTQRVEAGRARLRKYVTTETETVQVPVSQERLTVEREPITDANASAALDGPAISEEEHEVVLTGQEPVVAKEAVPVERVRLGTETSTEQVTVSDQVRKEQVDLDGDAERA